MVLLRHQTAYALQTHGLLALLVDYLVDLQAQERVNFFELDIDGEHSFEVESFGGEGENGLVSFLEFSNCPIENVRLLIEGEAAMVSLHGLKVHLLLHVEGQNKRVETFRKLER